MIISFFCKIHSYRKKKTSHGNFPIGCGANWPNKLSKKSMDEKSSSLVTHKSPLLFISHKMAMEAFRN
jgi:hypothetical protein